MHQNAVLLRYVANILTKFYCSTAFFSFWRGGILISFFLGLENLLRQIFNMSESQSDDGPQLKKTKFENNLDVNRNSPHQLIVFYKQLKHFKLFIVDCT